MFKRVFILSLLGLATGCSNVPPGYVGIVVNQYGSNKGVDQEVLGVGRVWLTPNESLYLFPTFQKNYTWTASKDEGKATDESFTFQSNDGMSINADVGISYHLLADKVPSIFQRYREGIDEINNTQMRNVIRDALNEAASTMGVTDLYGAKKTELLSRVLTRLRSDPTLDGIFVDNIYFVGTMRLPDTIVKALNEKVAASQRAQQRQNEVAEAQAEALKQVAKAKGEAEAALTRARAEAESNRLRQSSITPSLIQYEAVQKWNGTLPTMTTSGAVPFINLK